MKILMIGCGAVGLSLASALYESNVETDLVARGKTAEAIRKNGMERCGLFGHVAIAPDKIRVYDRIEETGTGYDFLLNCAKTTGNAAIAESLSRRKADILGDKGRLVLFQNGFGNEQAFAGILDRHRIYHASLAIGFRRTKPNVSEVTVMSQPVTIGSIFGDPAEACENLADAIRRGGIPCRVTDEIGKTLWAKLLYNCALNPLGAILKTSYGGLVKSGSSISLIETIIEEIFAVMHAAGYETFWKDSASYKREFFEKILPPTYGHRSSTLQDMERGIPTEIDSLNGAVVKLGERLQIATPCNTVITRIIKAAESLYPSDV